MLVEIGTGLYTTGREAIPTLLSEASRLIVLAGLLWGAGDLAILRSAGAYGATMASTYNSRPLVPEVLVSGDKFEVVAGRISAEAIMAEEHVPDWLK